MLWIPELWVAGSWDKVVVLRKWEMNCCCSLAQSCLTPCDPTDCSTPGFPVLHCLSEFAQTHVHWVGNAIQPSHPLLSPSPPAFNLSQHQHLFHWGSSLHQVAKPLELHLQHQSFQWIFKVDFLQDWRVWIPCCSRETCVMHCPIPPFPLFPSFSFHPFKYTKVHLSTEICVRRPKASDLESHCTLFSIFFGRGCRVSLRLQERIQSYLTRRRWDKAA